MGKAIFITGIDTDAGKTYATAWLASKLIKEGKTVITQKFIQTGCDKTSEDIEAHRRLIGSGPMPEDAEGLTAPIILHYPASAQLAARLDGVEIDLSKIDDATAELCRRYDIVLIEGAGGLFVPITDDFFSIDYIRSRNLPVMLVTSSKLGSINHTMLSLEALGRRGINVEAILYNTFFDAASKEIADDTFAFLKRHLSVPILRVPVL